MSTIREAKQNDVTTLKNQYRDFVTELSRFDSSAQSPDSDILRRIETSLIEKNSAIFVDDGHKGINGFVRIQHKERKSENEDNVIHYAKLSDLYVVPEARHQGIAGRLLKASVAWTENLKLTELILNVNETNELAYILYKRFGFKNDCAISNNRIRMKYNLHG